MQIIIKNKIMIKKILMATAFITGLMVINGCSEEEPEDIFEKNYNAGYEYWTANGQREEVTTTKSGLQYEILTEGEGKTPKATDKVRCRYEGRFINGVVFDSNNSENGIVFPLNGVIAGWTEGLQYMKEGAKYRFVIPHHLAYGTNGYASIPPCSTLIFDVELIEVVEE